MHLTATTRIAICLSFLSVSVILSARLIGLIPDVQRTALMERTAFCTAVGIQASYLAEKNDVDGLRRTLKTIVDRNNSLLSISLVVHDQAKQMHVVSRQQSDGATYQQTHAKGMSVDVPIMAGRRNWGSMQLTFRALRAGGIAGLMHDPVIRISGFVFAASGLVFLVYLRRILQHLDPSKVVPDRIRNALDTLSDGLLLLDKDERIVMANESFTKVARQSGAQLLGRHISELAWANEFGAVVDQFPWEQAARDRQPVSGTLYYQNPQDNRQQIFKVNTVPDLSENDELRGVLVCFDDVTLLHQKMNELGHLRQELVDTAREAGMAEIATDVLHNVGNVLNSVNVSVSMLSQNVKESRISYLNDLTEMFTEHRHELGDFLTHDERGKRIPDFLSKLTDQIRQEQSQNLDEINTLAQCVKHIKEIVLTQQSFAKVTAMLEKCHPNELMDVAVRFADVRTDKYDIKLVREYDQVPEVAVAKGKLLQALVNLIKNAQEALIETSDQDRTMTLRTRYEDGSLQLEVTDTGAGIASENLTKIFAHGFTTKHDGHGFGLHGSALAIKEMGGELRVESAGIGQGATFSIDIPVNQAEPVT